MTDRSVPFSTKNSKYTDRFEELLRENEALKEALEESKYQCNWLKKSLAQTQKQNENQAKLFKQCEVYEKENKLLEEEVANLKEEIAKINSKKYVNFSCCI